MRKHIVKVGLFSVFAVAALATGSASALTTASGCTFDDSVAGVWKLTADCTSTAQINVPANTLVRGGGHTVSPNFTKTGEDNNAVFGVINANGVTLRNLTIDGTGGTTLHGVNIYQSTSVKLNRLTIKNNDRNGVVVNGSTVTVRDLTTAANGWGGVDVDQGDGVTMPAVLTVRGVSNQTDVAHIYVDDATKNVTVNDVRGQYIVSHPGVKLNDKLYTLKKVVVSKADCKNGGWQGVMTKKHWGFKNQGQCVSYVEHMNKHHGSHHDHEHEDEDHSRDD